MLITLKGSTKVAPKGFSVVAEVEGLRLGPSRKEAAHLTRLTHINLPRNSTPAILPHGTEKICMVHLFSLFEYCALPKKQEFQRRPSKPRVNDSDIIHVEQKPDLIVNLQRH